MTKKNTKKWYIVSAEFEPMVSWFTAQNFNHWTAFTYIHLMNNTLNKPTRIVWQLYT